MGFALSFMQLTSSAFDNGGVIPTRFTGDAEDVSPAIS
ncbi:MAG TPA: YbhB/YbcL family Raf kinase inhibitor-like protein, partial [Woeseiaceae bacterium]|nr:YbhB/YbcL family Raf kinase inhibitor-like protein [Woeseiaceae bacterium]